MCVDEKLDGNLLGESSILSESVQVALVRRSDYFCSKNNTDLGVSAQ